jgi:hypothetical protein
MLGRNSKFILCLGNSWQEMSGLISLGFVLCVSPVSRHSGLNDFSADGARGYSTSTISGEMQ